MRNRLLAAALVFSAAATTAAAQTLPLDRRTEARIDSVLRTLTLAEKCGQLVQYTGDFDQTGPSLRPGYEQAIRAGMVGSMLNVYTVAQTRKLQDLALQARHKIPLVFGYDVIHGFRTIFPIPLGMAATWDTATVQHAARIAAREAAAAGLHWTFTPMVDIARDPRWGRVMEGAGEDTWLGSAMARAQVRGFQGDNLAADTTLAACAKHFAAYGAAEAGRDYNTVDMSEQRLRNVYLPPFQAAVNAGVATFMTAFNDLNGVPATANRFLLTEVLRREWGFTGMVVSDYNAVQELLPHGYARDSAHAAQLALLAGTDMDMMAGLFDRELPALVRAGKVPEAAVDEAVRRVLRLKFRLGLFDDPHRYNNEARERTAYLRPEARAAARDAAAKSFVLLKNEGDLLPLARTAGTVAVVGPLADAAAEMNGAWSAAGRTDEPVSVLAGLRAALPAGVRVLHAAGCAIAGGDTTGFAAAVQAARSADVVVAVLGEAAQMSGEAASRADIRLPGHQEALLQAVARTGKPVVLVLLAGRPLVFEWARANVPAILYAWMPGTEAGNAVADVLLGKRAPQGRLPMTFPRSVGQIPIYYNHRTTGRPMYEDTKYVSRYLDIANTPAYPFGYGLSYTRFAYSDLRLAATTMTPGKPLRVQVTVRNTGSRPGTETAQLYVHDEVASLTPTVRELRGYQQVRLAPGEARTLTFELHAHDLAFTHPDGRRYAEPGRFRVYVGPNAAEGLEAAFDLQAP